MKSKIKKKQASYWEENSKKNKFHGYDDSNYFVFKKILWAQVFFCWASHFITVGEKHYDIQR